MDGNREGGEPLNQGTGSRCSARSAEPVVGGGGFGVRGMPGTRACGDPGGGVGVLLPRRGKRGFQRGESGKGGVPARRRGV